MADLCVDLMVTGSVQPRFGQFEQLVDGYSVEAGGSGAIFASQFAKLGGAVRLLGAVGADPFADVALGPLSDAGIGLDLVRRKPDLPTGLGLHLVKPDGDRATLTVLGAIAAPGPDDLTSDLLRECRHWHLASLFLLDRLRHTWPDWLRRCRTAGLTVSLDTNWDPADAWVGVRELLPLVDVFLPNEAEARRIADAADTTSAGERLSEAGPVVVVKCGADGALLFREGRCVGGCRRDPAAAALMVADTVGAGDSFDAGFLRAWLAGRSDVDCLALGARCAEATLAQPGGFRGQLREVMR